MNDTNTTTTVEQNAYSEDTLLLNARQYVFSGDFSKALIWIAQLVSIYKANPNDEKQAVFNDLIATIIVKASTKIIVSCFKSGNLGNFQRADLEVALKASEKLLEIEGPDPVLKNIIQSRLNIARDVLDLSQKHVSTGSPELDSYMNELWEVIKLTSSLTSEEDKEVIPPAERVKLAATALTNAKSMLSWFFPETFSDWFKAMVICRQVKDILLPGLEIYHRTSATKSIDEALGHLARRDYRKSRDAIQAAETTMTNYTWKH